MKYALDASVALKVVLPESDSPKAHALMRDFKNRVHELIAPDTLPVEVAHAITRAERKGIIQPPDGLQRFQQIATVFPQLHDYIPLLSRAFELSSRMRIGVFDCLYIALAEREQCQVVTSDQRMLTLFPAEAISLASV